MYVSRVVVFLTQLWRLSFLYDRPLLNKRDIRDIISVLRKVADALDMDNDFDLVYDDGGQQHGLSDNSSALWRLKPTLAPLYYQTESYLGAAGNRIYVDDFTNGDESKMLQT